MGPYIALEWSAVDGQADQAAQRFDLDIAAAGRWTVLQRSPGFVVYAERRRPLRLRRLAGCRGIVLGELFDDAGGDAPDVIDGSEEGEWIATATALIGKFWGRYGAIFRDRAGRIEGLVRDPSGAVELATWRRAGVRFVTSDIANPVLSEWFAPVGVAWPVVRSYLCDFGLVTGLSALTSIDALAPGAGLDVSGEGTARPVQIWKPELFAHDTVREAAEAKRTLRTRVQTCIAAHARGAGQILTEVSGGLDSSIVAACLSQSDPGRLRWLHHANSEPGGDELKFVTVLEQALHIEVVRQSKPPFTLNPEDLARSQFGVRPSFTALDAPYDAAMVQMATELGADTLFTAWGETASSSFLRALTSPPI